MNADYNDIAKTFARSRKNLKWAEIEYFMDFIKEHNISLEGVLDVGCGSGRLLESLQDIDVSPDSYLGIDVSEGLLQEARTSFPQFDFCHSDMNRIGEIDGQFSCLFFIASFHHILSPTQRQEILSQAYKKLKKGGYVFFTNWYLLGGQNQEKYGSCLISESDNDFSIKIGKVQRIYHGFSPKELQELMEASGFHVIENRVFDGQKNIVTIAQKK